MTLPNQPHQALVPASSSATEQHFDSFKKFVLFFSELFSTPGFMDDVPCRESYKQYLPQYYSNIFGPSIKEIKPRHLKWFRSLSPMFSLPKGATIVDYGGGYGLDSIFLASLGYHMVFCEITPHHIAIAQSLSKKFSDQFHPIQMTFVLAVKDEAPSGVDAVFLNEVAHHIEPVQQVFTAAAKMLRPGGHLYLLEPNYLCPAVQAFFFKVRGFNTIQQRTDEQTGQPYLWGNENIRLVSTWNRHARDEGLKPCSVDYVIPWYLRGEAFRPSGLRQQLEKLPVSKHFLASHVMLRYQKG